MASDRPTSHPWWPTDPEPAQLYVAARGSLLSAFGIQDVTRRCLFCGRREDAVGKLVGTRDAFICDRCVRQAIGAIDDSADTDKLVRMRPPRIEPADRAGAEDAIERAYEIVLASGLSDRERTAAIESGDNLLETMREVQSRFPIRPQIDVAVDYVRFLDEDEAEVGYGLLLPGQRPLPGAFPSKGYAVRQGGTWKMARATYAELVGRAGVAVPPAE